MKKGKKVFVYVLAVFAILGPIINYSSRIGYVFVDSFLFNGFSKILLWIFVINAINMFILSFRVIKGKDIEKNPFKALFVTGIVITTLSILANSAYSIYSPRDIPVYWMYFVRILPYLAILFCSLFILFILPNFKKTTRKVVSIALMVAIFLVTTISVFDLYVFRFSSNPVVFDTGNEYLVTWATNDEATGFVEYSYNGKDYKIYDNSGGRINTDTIHTVEISYEHLEENNYSVGSTRVIDEIGYGGTNGKTLTSQTYNFKGKSRENPNIVFASDWHTRTKKMLNTAKYLDEPDIVVMLGDYMDAIYDKKGIVKNIIYASAELTSSECPAILVRGNHDTRGEASADFMQYFGLDEFYYNVNYGDIDFIVLDTTEDKEDNNPQYGGLADFHNYRIEQTQWLETQQATNNKYTIVLAHDPNIFIEKDLTDRVRDEFERLEVSFIVSGHIHEVGIEKEEGQIMQIYSGGLRSNIFKICQIKINGNSIHYKAMDSKGNIIEDEDVLVIEQEN